MVLHFNEAPDVVDLPYPAEIAIYKTFALDEPSQFPCGHGRDAD
jgi:hypothetical protein